VRLAMLEVDGNISMISGDEHLKETHFKRKAHRRLASSDH